MASNLSADGACAFFSRSYIKLRLMLQFSNRLFTVIFLDLQSVLMVLANCILFITKNLHVCIKRKNTAITVKALEIQQKLYYNITVVKDNHSIAQKEDKANEQEKERPQEQHTRKACSCDRRLKSH